MRFRAVVVSKTPLIAFTRSHSGNFSHTIWKYKYNVRLCVIPATVAATTLSCETLCSVVRIILYCALLYCDWGSVSYRQTMATSL